MDIVYVATPHTLHHANTAQALRSGKHVLVEKPFTINAAQAVDLIELARANSLVVLEAMWTRWLPHMVRIREIITGGVLGPVRSMHADHSQLLPADPAHRLNAPELGGGALLDLGVYPVSFASDLFGPPQSVQAAATLTPTGVDGHVAAILSYPAGAIATFQCASTMRGPNTATVTGPRGRIEIDAVWYTPATLPRLRQRQRPGGEPRTAGDHGPRHAVPGPRDGRTRAPRPALQRRAARLRRRFP